MSSRNLVSAAGQHDPGRGAYDFMKLLNTNFDSPQIYWALGYLYKELWQLEAAGMWFEQMQLFPSLAQDQRALGFLELADCYIWKNENLEKAIEFFRSTPKNARPLRVQALRVGPAVDEEADQLGRALHPKLVLDVAEVRADGGAHS